MSDAPVEAPLNQPRAAIDIGTNTVRLLIARTRPDGTLERLDDQAVTVRLGLGVDQSRRLAPERMERAATVVADFAARARAAGAPAPWVLATSAVRDAANQAEFVALVAARAGLAVAVIDGDREARLTVRGALLGRSVAGRWLVADIGGGSTEIIIAADGRIELARSLQLGSGRVTERCLPSDPPTPDEVAAARQLAAATVASVASTRVDGGVLVGGTASGVPRLLPASAAAARLTRADLAALLTRLLAVPAATIAADGAVDVDRARVMPGGLIVIEALLRHFLLNDAFISQGGIREGLLLEQAAAANEGS